MVRRHLASVFDSLGPRRAAHHAIVIDDSEPTAAAAIGRIAAELRSKGTQVTVFDRRDRRALAQRLTTTLPAATRTTVRDALIGGPSVRTGASRNAARLAFPDTPTAWFDDDVVLRPHEVPEAQRADRRIVRGDPTELWFFERPEDAAALDTAPASDPLRPLEEALHPADAPARVHPVLATFGLAGDSGMSSPLFALAAVGPTRARLRDPAAYRRATTTRAVIRGATARSYSVAPAFMSFAFGTPTMRGLPPFPPSGRNQDAAFAALTLACHPEAAFVHVPWVVPHLPPETRRFDPEADPMPMRPNDALLLLARGFSSQETHGAARMMALAEALERHASHDLAAHLESCHHQARSALLEHLDLLAQREPVCAAWIDDVQRLRRRPPLRVPQSHARALTRHVRQYATLLRAWPELERLASF